MIHVKHLFHSYSKNEQYAVKDVNFQVEKEEIFGFLGPSGAGKSTTQGILTGLLPLQKGEVLVAGYDIKKPKREMFNKIGVSFEQSNVYDKLSGRENLEFYAKLFDVPTLKAEELLKQVGLWEVANQKAGSYSKGMKHRLTFARSMLNHPELWFLDEPTTGLDPAIASEIKEMIRTQRKKGTTVFLTTHNMHIADELCDRVAFIVEGEIKRIDTPRNLKLQYGQKFVRVEYHQEGQLIKRKFSLMLQEEKEELKEIIETKEIELMHTTEATLEEIFIKVTGKELI